MEWHENVKAAESLKRVRKWLLVHKHQRWYKFSVKGRHLRRLYFDMMLNDERFESKWTRILVLIRKYVLWGEIVAVLGNTDYDAKESANLHSELELDMWITLYWQWNIHNRRRKRGRTSWVCIHVVEWVPSSYSEKRDIVYVVGVRLEMNYGILWYKFDLIWFLKNKKSKIYVLNSNWKHYVDMKKHWKSSKFWIFKFCLSTKLFAELGL